MRSCKKWPFCFCTISGFWGRSDARFGQFYWKIQCLTLNSSIAGRKKSYSYDFWFQRNVMIKIGRKSGTFFFVSETIVPTEKSLIFGLHIDTWGWISQILWPTKVQKSCTTFSKKFHNWFYVFLCFFSPCTTFCTTFSNFQKVHDFL